MTDRLNRREVLKALGVTGVGAGAAGCIGGADEDTNGGSGGSGGSAAASFPDFSVEDPQFPQLWSTLVGHEYEFGLEQDLEQMEEQDEAYYGRSPREPPEDESEWLDPDPIEFAYFPAENPAGYADSLTR